MLWQEGTCHTAPRPVGGGGEPFKAAYCAQPICSPSRASLLTGKAPARLHLTNFLPGRPDATSQKLLHPQMAMQLPPEEVTLAELLKPAGYATACVGKWHLGGNAGPGTQGFDFVFAGNANTKPTSEEGGKGEHQLTEKRSSSLRQTRAAPSSSTSLTTIRTCRSAQNRSLSPNTATPLIRSMQQ